MRDIDPRDYEPREHEDRWPQLGRGGGAADGVRGPDRTARDPRDIAVRHLDLPIGPRREPLRIRGRDLVPSESSRRETWKPASVASTILDPPTCAISARAD